jgi:3-oxoacyl-[acyl-carrier protein] reductase
MLIRFDGRTAIVAGAARGIGETIALSLASDGARVIACDLLVEGLAAVAGCVDCGGEIIAAKADVTDETSIAEVVRAASGADILVYVAGGVRGQEPRPLEQVSADDFDAIVDANLKGAFLFAKAVAPGMKAKGTGRTVTISGRAGLATSLTGIPGYTAAVNTIAMRRMGTPQHIANAVTFLASDQASWITGRTIPVTGGPLA